MKKKQQICILGSTGSIGTQALDVVRQHPELFEVYTLTAHNNVDLLAAQAREFSPASVVIANEDRYEDLKTALADCPNINIYAGSEALNQVVQSSAIDTVLAAMVGFSGLLPTINAIKAGKRICLANKETLVVAGELILDLVSQYHVDLLPVDSEHSAIFQCLVGEDIACVDQILLTCSGGPFRNHTPEQLQSVTAADALRHPTWNMGDKITIDSATLMNKGFEVMEARWLFGIDVARIQVLIHPQSVVHSGVSFIDGAVKAQLGVPDMRLPILYAFAYPDRQTLKGERLNLFKTGHLDFMEPDPQRFPCLQLAYQAMSLGGNMPCILNAANEVANAAFRNNRCTFMDIPRIIERTMQTVHHDKTVSLDTYLDTDAEARSVAQRFINA